MDASRWRGPQLTVQPRLPIITSSIALMDHLLFRTEPLRNPASCVQAIRLRLHWCLRRQDLLENLLLHTSSSVFDCPRFQGLWQQHAGMFQDSHDAMSSLMGHKEQKSVLLCWPWSMRARQHDRFWLFGRSEYPFPPRSPSEEYASLKAP